MFLGSYRGLWGAGNTQVFFWLFVLFFIWVPDNKVVVKINYATHI